MTNLTNAAEIQCIAAEKSSDRQQARPEHGHPNDVRIPEPLFTALLDAGYTGSDRLRDFAANAVSAQQIFRFFQTETPAKPWQTIDRLMQENLLLKRQAFQANRHCDLFASIYDHHVGQWYTLVSWLKTQGLTISEHIENMGREARMELLRFEGLAPK